MSVFYKNVFIIFSVICFLSLAFAQTNKKSSKLDSAFDESLAEELEEGFSDIEEADSEEFGTPKTPTQTEEDLISEEFDELEQEETPSGNQKTVQEQDIIDEEIDAEFGQDELEREESPDVAEDLPEAEDQVVSDEELDAEFDEDELEREEFVEPIETDTAETLDVPEETPPESEEVLAEEPQEETDIAEELEETQPEPEEEFVEEEVPPEPEEILAEPTEQLEQEPQEESLPEPLPPSEALASFVDEPDRELEAFLDRVFKNNMERLSDERWSQIIGDRQTDTYTIQVGDTLWDISVTFFGNGHFWPKLWQLNSLIITNPHLIYPGRILKFVSGNVSTPPEIALTDVQEEALATQSVQQQVADESGIEEGDEYSMSIEGPIIPPARVSPPIRKTLPESLLKSSLNVQGFLTNQSGNLTEQGELRIENITSSIKETRIQALHFLSEFIPQSLGKIVDVEEWHKTAGLLQHVYIQGSNLSIGRTYSVFRRKDRVRGSGGRMLGFDIELQGEVEITQKLPFPPNIYKAVVKKHNTFIEEGSQIAILNMPFIKLNLEGPQKNIVAEVVGGGNVAAPHDLFARHSLIFLDKGSQAGLATGDILTVRRNQRVRDKSRFVQADTPPIATIKVAKVTPQRTTAFVIQSSEEIFIGDYTSGQ